MSNSSRRSARGNAGEGSAIARIKARLRIAIEAGNLYEANQLYSIIYSRLSGEGKFQELEELLFTGTLQMFDRSEVGSAIDIVKLYLNVLSTGDLERKEETFQRVAKLYTRIPADHVDKDNIMARVLNWAKVEGYQHGHPRLHQVLAYNLWSDKRYPESRQHFMHAYDGQGCGSMLVDFHTSRGYNREVDLFVVGTVLQLLCLKKHIVAAGTLKAYTEKHPSIRRGPPYIHPLLNFVWLLLLAIEHKKSVTAFSVLVEKYKSSLHRDPSFLEYLDKIGQAFFGLPPPPKQPSGLFGSLFDSFFSALNEEEDEGDRGAARKQVKMETDELE